MITKKKIAFAISVITGISVVFSLMGAVTSLENININIIYAYFWFPLSMIACVMSISVFELSIGNFYSYPDAIKN